MSFWLVPKSVTLDDLKRHYFTEIGKPAFQFQHITASAQLIDQKSVAIWRQIKSCRIHGLKGYSVATPHFGTRFLLYFLYSKHCDRPTSCDEERRPVAEFISESVAFCSKCTMS